ncbi:MAG: histidine kinase dimerization/phospho-acceptor domain-containing protein, partial [Candidatus Dormibacteria bacterium]
MASRTLAILCAAAALAAGAAHARPLMSPAELATAIEARAEKTSFTALEAFGARAARGDDPESLNRLEHVAQVFLNQSEFDRFEKWNAVLRRNAQQAHDHRYEAVAQINEMKSRYDRGDLSAETAMATEVRIEPDWFARSYATSNYAQMLIEDDRTGEALKLLSQASTAIPEADHYANAAKAQIWEGIGLALMGLYDIKGSAASFDRADFQDTDPAYPRPDFDGVYDMAHVAVELGDAPLARKLAAIHHRLAVRSDLPHLRVWDMNLCGMTAEAFGSPREVTACFKGLDRKLTGAEFLASRLLPMRAVAEARLGDVAGAQADLDRFRSMQASKLFEAAQFSREPEVEGEILLAKGEDRAALAKLRAYYGQKAVHDSQTFNVGVRQLTGEMEKQLEVAERNGSLKQDVIREQRWVGALSVIFVLGAALALVWQRQAGRKLKLAQQKAESANRAKSAFLANMSHEIRTPLNGVVGVADLLAKAELGAREREMVEIIRGSGQSLERLLSDVLDLARVEAGRMT